MLKGLNKIKIKNGYNKSLVLNIGYFSTNNNNLNNNSNNSNNSNDNNSNPKFKIKISGLKSLNISKQESLKNTNNNNNNNSISSPIEDSKEPEIKSTNENITAPPSVPFRLKEFKEKEEPRSPFSKLINPLKKVKELEKGAVKSPEIIKDSKNQERDSAPRIRDDETLISELKRKVLIKVKTELNKTESDKPKPIEEMSEELILQYLRHKSKEYRVAGEEVNLKDCPFCVNVQEKLDNMWKLYIHSHTGLFFCHRCSTKGNWNHLRLAFGDLKQNFRQAFQPAPVNKAPPPPPIKSMLEHISEVPKDVLEKIETYSKQLDKFPKVLQKLTGTGPGERGIKKEVLEYYLVGATNSKFKSTNWDSYECVTFPWTAVDEQGKIIQYRCKLRAIESKVHQRLEPAGSRWGFFGWHTIPNDCKLIVITEGEYDAMAVYQETGLPTISLPNGFASFPQVMIPLFDRFEKIILWMDDDLMGRAGAANFSDLLGSQKTHVIFTKQGQINGPKDANDALLMGKDFKEIIASAKPIHKFITDYMQERPEIAKEFEFFKPIPETYTNQLLPTLYKLLLPPATTGRLNFFLGLRVSVLVSQFALHNAVTNNISTLYVTGDHLFKPKQFMVKMVTQYLNLNGKENVDEFAKVPIHFSVSDKEGFKEILQTMALAILQYNVKHIVLDNVAENQYQVAPFVKIVKKFLNNYKDDINITMVQSFLIDRPTNKEILDDVDNYLQLYEGENFDDLVYKKIQYKDKPEFDCGVANVFYDTEPGLYHELNYKNNSKVIKIK
ncbi:hypothetical protein DICPUDRAFT_97936 [Dictyostelium purpureum]|uniref:Toprim domain-containing protein n=1 Tax=Dictyostelium purpureum TaxID=5786 RepID=F0ZL70_DICPU|nr:uncharacterized protein DICPUDRAFT_97936 [Dictyostelium purpureum]EGC35307.1 hypothetical protein DICPUDRAFT_97936 [Dictyostelium purpureum]|eukprot:XP_003288174.1 hypothetical protein DICPUDRAFT_97936 [Dictyostelium purpureum]